VRRKDCGSGVIRGVKFGAVALDALYWLVFASIFACRTLIPSHRVDLTVLHQ
jgi:hypothetical protein